MEARWILKVARPGTSELRWLEEFDAGSGDAVTSSLKIDARRLTHASAQVIGDILYQRGWYVSATLLPKGR
jgi:hypothetical protein